MTRSPRTSGCATWCSSTPSRSRRRARCSSANWRPVSAPGREQIRPDPNGCGGGHRPPPLTIVPRGTQPGEELNEHTGVQIAHVDASPTRQVARRLVFALVVFVLTVLLVYVDRDGYRDLDEVGGISLLDAAYYATVSLSTTGYGDITPVTDQARLINFLVITPLRVLFLIVLIGTTLEALTTRSREEFRIRRWRSRVRQHVIVCGYGTKGRSAIRSLQASGTPLERIIVVDPEPRAIDEANALGLTGIVGDAGRTEVLRRASVERARGGIVAANPDDAPVLLPPTLPQLNPTPPGTPGVPGGEKPNPPRPAGADHRHTPP